MKQKDPIWSDSEVVLSKLKVESYWFLCILNVILFINASKCHFADFGGICHAGIYRHLPLEFTSRTILVPTLPKDYTKGIYIETDYQHTLLLSAREIDMLFALINIWPIRNRQLVTLSISTLTKFEYTIQ